MDRDLFFDEEWQIIGFEDNVVQLENDDGTKFMNLNVDKMLYLLGKMHLQYDDEDLDTLFE